MHFAFLPLACRTCQDNKTALLVAGDVIEIKSMIKPPPLVLMVMEVRDLMTAYFIILHKSSEKALTALTGAACLPQSRCH